MSDVIGINRVEYLAEKFGVFENNTHEVVNSEVERILKTFKNPTEVTEVYNQDDDSIIALLLIEKVIKHKSDGETTYKDKKSVMVGYSVFKSMLDSDPTSKKKYTQWMLNNFTRLIKDESTITEGIRFVVEDLPLAMEYLTIF